LNFRTKTVLGIALIESILLVILVFSALNFLHDSNEKQLLQRATITSRLFGNAVKDAVLSTDLATLESFVEEIISNPDIVYTRIRNNEVILAQGGNLLVLNQPHIPDISLSDVTDGIYDIHTEIVVEGIVYGHIEMGLSTSAIENMLAEARRWIGGIASLEIILVGLFSFALGTYLTRQLAYLKEASNIITLSGPGHQIPISGNDEVTAVARAFNKMSSKLNRVMGEHASIANELTQLIDTANAPIFGIDAQGNINEWNQQLEKTTSFKKTEIIGLHLVADVITSNHKASIGLILANALKGDETANYELALYTKAGDRIDILLSSSTRRDASDNIVGVVCVGQDITELNNVRHERECERQKAAAQIIQASKLATLGEMATSVAHELNQPLNVIRMASSNSRRRIDKGNLDPQYLIDKLNRIEEQTTRAAAIIDHMRMFGREAKESAVLVDPCKIVMKTLDLIGEQLRLSGIEVVTVLDKKCSPILGHPILMEQVVLNLLTNARDAITQRNGKSKITIRVFEDDKGINIITEDTGGGIAENTLSRIFEPFFTTKTIGKGTGLGLSVSYGIITDINGTIIAENIEGGARFIINIPVNIH
jgi:PAS domain S-box-containing protein